MNRDIEEYWGIVRMNFIEHKFGKAPTIVYEDLHFQIAKMIAETDSIGEGYGYCSEYDQRMFENPDCEYKQLAAHIIEQVLNYRSFVLED